ncbi:MAG: DUF2752 domain-containing protein [Cyclobacteriaceae bacterium]|nr:DUF2752 domain-containing protein [Cyclobacteriaceae bacterium]
MKYFSFPREAWYWIIAIAALALYMPDTDTHIVICPLKLVGFDHCPGCGLGRAIAFALKGELKVSLGMHPLGIPGLLIILHRIYYLIYKHLKHHGKSTKNNA